MRNFRNRVILYHVRNPDYEDLPTEHAQLLVLRKEVTTTELNMLNNALARLNLNGVFRKIMQQYNNTWEELSLLKEKK